eukprot:g9614.t1
MKKKIGITLIRAKGVFFMHWFLPNVWNSSVDLPALPTNARASPRVNKQLEMLQDFNARDTLVVGGCPKCGLDKPCHHLRSKGDNQVYEAYFQRDVDKNFSAEEAAKKSRTLLAMTKSNFS